jgi:poly-gamma-glutamate capsule biosynthesis protein CapA/YwtB (metallophosphatase superfamily)
VGRAGRANAQGSDAEYDFRPLFAGVAPTIAGADLAICHLETPLAFGGRFTPFPRFNGPHELAEAIADAGFDGCSTASNHSYDQASEGIDATLDVLDAAGLGHAGTARSAEEAATTSLYDVSGISVAHLSYTYGLNGFVLGADETWRVAVIDPEMIVADAARARDGGAELVVVSLHWGLEYFRMPTVAQEELARTLADSGIVDIVVGHHAHVLQPMTTIGHTLVLYGLGNMLSNQEPQCCTVYSQDGAIVTVRVADGENGVEVTGVDITPTWVDRSTMQIVPVVARLAAHETGDELPRWMAGHLEASLARTLDSLGLLGAVLPEPR